MFSNFQKKQEIEEPEKVEKKEIPNRLDALEEGLYSTLEKKEEKDEPFPRDFGHSDNSPVQSKWSDVEIPVEINTKTVSAKNTFSVLKRVLIASIILFAASICVAVYIFLGDKNVISTKNVVIGIKTTSSVAGGEKLPIEISVANQNNVALLTTDVLIEYSEGGREPNDPSKELRRYRETIGPISIGGTINKKYEVIFFGEEGQNKEVKVSVEYRVQGSNAIFSKSETRSVSLSSAPVAVSVDSLPEYSSGEDSIFTVTVSANASGLVQNLMLQADYPFGFKFTGSDPKSTFDNNVWDLGDLKPGSSRVIHVKGQFSGTEGEERVIRFLVGAKDARDNRKIGVVFLSKTQTIKLAKPSMGLELLFGGVKDQDYVISAGKNVRTDVVVKNNLSTRITNIVIKAKINGTIFDRGSVSPSQGFFRSNESTITWDQTLDKNLASLEPGAVANVNFSFDTLRSAVNLKSPSMSVEATVTGSKVSETSSVEQIKVSAIKSLKIASEMAVSSKILYSSGPFQNSGPVPPKPDQETTYTVTLSLTNTTNDLSDLRVTTGLPIYSRWVNKISPVSEIIKYNPIGGEIVWEAGDLKVGSGPKEVSFQIAFSPSVTQVGSSPLLIDRVSASGYDRFSGVTLSAESSGSSDISLPNDPIYKGNGGPVRQ